MAILLGACAVGPDFVRPAAPAADRYTRDPLPPATAIADGRAQQFSPDVELRADWWRLFGSAQVDAAVQKLLYHLQLQQVPVGIKPLGTAAARFGERRAA